MESLALRPSCERDRLFLESLYASTREADLARVSWNMAQKRLLIRTQFEAQCKHFAACFPQASLEVITHADEPIGRLYVDRSAHAYRVVDIALLPEHRGRGIGTRLLSSLVDEARENGRLVCAHVPIESPAERLYARLGFLRQRLDGTHQLWEWQATS